MLVVIFIIDASKTKTNVRDEFIIKLIAWHVIMFLAAIVTAKAGNISILHIIEVD